jgi:hypothetical protein
VIERLLTSISDWPVIVQGALGSALFAAVLFLGQKATGSLSSRYSAVSRERRRNFLLEQRLKYSYKLAKDMPTRAAIFSGLLYRASKNALRAAVWLTLGLIFSTFLPVLGLVGFLGALYYLFAALNTVTPVPEVDDIAERLKELTVESKTLGD